jgi:hypothetical protein
MKWFCQFMGNNSKSTVPDENLTERIRKIRDDRNENPEFPQFENLELTHIKEEQNSDYEDKDLSINSLIF